MQVFLQVNSVMEELVVQSSVQIAELEYAGTILVPMPKSTRKRKQKVMAPNSMEFVRRSLRIAKLKDGFKDPVNDVEASTSKTFTVAIRDEEAPHHLICL